MLLAERRDGGAPDAAAIAGARRALIDGETTLVAITEALELRLRTDVLVPIAHWTTPPIMPRRFDTRFFAAELPRAWSRSFGTEEVVGHRWLTARAALDAMAAGDVAMWLPTSATLQQLEYAARPRRTSGPGSAPATRPRRASSGRGPGATRVVLGSAGAVPGQTVNAYLVGGRELVLVDPGDPSDAAADAILAAAAAAGGRIVAIALTHADPDHAAGAEALALRLELPILAGPGAQRDLPYLVRELADGERIGAGDVELEVVATPGPRPDHVAFAVVGSGRRRRPCRRRLRRSGVPGRPSSVRRTKPPGRRRWSASASWRPVRLFPATASPDRADVSRGATPPGSGAG